LAALATETAADLKAIVDARAFTDVAKPYIDAEHRKDLPKDWIDRRRDVLSGYVSLASVDSASRAASRLRSTFIALVENKLEPGAMGSLFTDINAILDLIEFTQGQTGS